MGLELNWHVIHKTMLWIDCHLRGGFRFVRWVPKNPLTPPITAWHHRLQR